jgi:multidrug efflux pump subunit AcrB
VLGADLNGVTIDQAVEIIKNLPEAKSLPPGVRLQEAGDAEISGEVRQAFVDAMRTGITLVLGVLVLLFGSIFPPITVILSLPLSFGGVVIGLLVTNNPVSMPVFIGVLMLMGVVTKNAIMLVEFAAVARERGLERLHAIREAGHKRARPIVMTTIAMTAGMLPSAWGVGDGGEFRSPMAIAVIGGLIVSTLLSLVFVPSFYAVMDDVSRLVHRLLGRFLGKREDESQWQPMTASVFDETPVSPPERKRPKLAAE